MYRFPVMMRRYAAGNVLAQVIVSEKSLDDSNLEETSPTADSWGVHCLIVLHPASSSSANSGTPISGETEAAARMAIRADFYLTAWVADHHCCLGVSSGGRTSSALSSAPTALSELAAGDAWSVAKSAPMKVEAVVVVRLC